MGTSSTFVDLQTLVTASGSGTVPSKFRTSGVIRDFLVTGNIENAKNRVAWSGINDISTWEAGVSSSDTQDLPGSGGQVVAITSGEVGYVFRQDQIIRMDFVGGATIFRFSVISLEIGCCLWTNSLPRQQTSFLLRIRWIFSNQWRPNIADRS